MSQDISREHEPSGFLRVFGMTIAALAVGGLGWAWRRNRADVRRAAHRDKHVTTTGD